MHGSPPTFSDICHLWIKSHSIDSGGGTLAMPPPCVGKSRQAICQPGILSMKPTIDASLPSVESVAKSTPSTTDGPAAGPSDQAKRTALLWLSILEMRFSTK